MKRLVVVFLSLIMLFSLVPVCAAESQAISLHDYIFSIWLDEGSKWYETYFSDHPTFNREQIDPYPEDACWIVFVPEEGLVRLSGQKSNGSWVVTSWEGFTFDEMLSLCHEMCLSWNTFEQYGQFDIMFWESDESMNRYITNAEQAQGYIDFYNQIYLEGSKSTSLIVPSEKSIEIKKGEKKKIEIKVMKSSDNVSLRPKLSESGVCYLKWGDRKRQGDAVIFSLEITGTGVGKTELTLSLGDDKTTIYIETVDEKNTSSTKQKGSILKLGPNDDFAIDMVKENKYYTRDSDLSEIATTGGYMFDHDEKMVCYITGNEHSAMIHYYPTEGNSNLTAAKRIKLCMDLCFSEDAPFYYNSFIISPLDVGYYFYEYDEISANVTVYYSYIFVFMRNGVIEISGNSTNDESIYEYIFDLYLNLMTTKDNNGFLELHQ